MPLTKPLNNNVLIEVTRDYMDVSRSTEDESMKYGVVVDYSVSPWHITASSAKSFAREEILIQTQKLEAMKGKTVRWEEFAEGGQTFEEDGKTYALIPWWRLISVYEKD